MAIAESLKKFAPKPIGIKRRQSKGLIVTSQAWTQALIEEEKSRVRAQVTEWRAAGGEEAALAGILKAIEGLDARSSGDRLRMYLFGVYALITQRNIGLLTDAKWRQVSDLCFKALQGQKIDPKFSKLAYLYSDVHALNGQIARTVGAHRSGVWQQLMGERYLRHATSDSEVFHSFTLALRFLRLGMIDAAEKLVGPLVFGPKDTQHYDIWPTMCLTQLTIFRLKQQYDKAEEFHNQLKGNPRFTSEQQLDLEWESFCRHGSQTRDLSPMFTATATGSSHDAPSYLVESVLWAFAFAREEWIEASRNLARESARQRKLYKKVGAAFPIALALQECGKGDLSPELRLNQLGAALDDAARITSLDVELLTWVAAGKALKRAQFNQFSMVCLLEYQGISNKYSNGSTSDILRADSSSETKPAMLLNERKAS